MERKRLKFQAPTGMHDILPEDQVYFRKVYKVVEDVAKFYNFQRIDVPMMEAAELYSKGIGLATDVVGKEMYTLKTKGGDYLALRPEFTAGIARAYQENGLFNLPQPLKLFSSGSLFRHEKPQAGRYREFHQFDFEVFGEKNPVIDVQIIQILYDILKELKFRNLIIEVNSIGDRQCRPYYRKLLVSYLKYRKSFLCHDCQRRLKENPLRVLDCKKEGCRKVVSGAPQIIDHLCRECHDHFKYVLEFLDELGLPYRLNPYLVRGLDYYTKTVFEIIEDSEEGRKIGSLGGGGRFDDLVKLLGGKETPACGMAGGVERIVFLMKSRGMSFPVSSAPRVFLAQLGEFPKKRALKIFEEFRKAKIRIAESFSKDSLKTQLRIADKIGVDYALVLGQREALEGVIMIRNMKTGKQDTVKIEDVVGEIKKRLKK